MLLAAASHPAAAALLPYPVDDQAAPVLNLSDLGGTQHSLDAYRGKVVLVNFWATWCAPCLVEMPGMQRLLDAMEGQPFTILAVNVKETKATAWRFMNLLKVNFPALLDSDGTATAAWEVQFYPTSFLIDSAGNIRYTAHGMIDWDSDEIRQIIEQLIPDNKAVIHETNSRP
jgi:thiol-disulfide isomerase/thioredoxin